MGRLLFSYYTKPLSTQFGNIVKDCSLALVNHTIRPLAICLFQSSGAILVAEGYDGVKGTHFYRPIGGGIEFGETSSAALVREVKEELGADIADLRYLGTVENIFTFNGNMGHEIVQVYDGRFQDTTLYDREHLEGEDDGNVIYRAMWKPLDEFRDHRLQLVPNGLLELLNKPHFPNTDEFVDPTKIV